MIREIAEETTEIMTVERETTTTIEITMAVTAENNMIVSQEKERISNSILILTLDYTTLTILNFMRSSLERRNHHMTSKFICSWIIIEAMTAEDKREN